MEINKLEWKISSISSLTFVQNDNNGLEIMFNRSLYYKKNEEILILTSGTYAYNISIFKSKSQKIQYLWVLAVI